MTVKELRQLLFKLDQEAVVDIASDEEGNSFGTVDKGISVGKLKNGKKVYSLFPVESILAEERYQF